MVLLPFDIAISYLRTDIAQDDARNLHCTTTTTKRRKGDTLNAHTHTHSNQP